MPSKNHVRTHLPPPKDESADIFLMSNTLHMVGPREKMSKGISQHFTKGSARDWLPGAQLQGQPRKTSLSCASRIITWAIRLHGGWQQVRAALLSLSLFNVYFFQREGAQAGEGGWERERAPSRGGTERVPSRLHAVGTEPNMGLDLTNGEIWAEPNARRGLLTHWATQALVSLPYVTSSHWYSWTLGIGLFFTNPRDTSNPHSACQPVDRGFPRPCSVNAPDITTVQFCTK